MYRLRQLERWLFNFYGRSLGAAGLGDKLRPALSTRERHSIHFVCSGNICRSPYAEVRFRMLAEEAGLKSVEVSSSGTATTPGKPADPTACTVAAARGVSLAEHRTSGVAPDTIAEHSLVIIMAPIHARQLKRLAPNALQKTAYLGAYGAAADLPLVIDDPFGQPEEVFSACYDLIDQALPPLLETVRKATLQER